MNDPKPIPTKKLRERRCKLKSCQKKFVPIPTPAHPIPYCCSPNCYYEYLKVLKTNKAKKEKKDWYEKNQTQSELIQEFQKVFNTFIRLRDKDLGCISCGTMANVEYAAGHFYPTTYSGLRFNEDNVHKQCNKHCNMMLRGNIQEYRPNLIKKIGIEKVEWLDANRHIKLDLGRQELKERIIFYNELIKKLK